MPAVIRSAANPLVKRARAVGAGRERGFVLLEGRRLVEEALEARWELDFVLVAEGARRAPAADVHAHRVDPRVLARVSPMKGAPDVLAVAREPQPRPLTSFAACADGLLVVAAGVQDPGNLGAIGRAAEAAAATGLVVAGEGARPFGAKALRGSMGSLLRLSVGVAADAGAGARALRAAGWRQALATARGGVDHVRFDWNGPLALWLAAESGALPPELGDEAATFERVSIPMAGPVESLNVATAAAILCFTAGRVPRPVADPETP